ncbi:MAG: transposase zinc-binding domain-containing protein, partial [Myxococcota bacterium]|nr:transposase zinc-binding domain-containing protein [Myxococcota bacterium]
MPRKSRQVSRVTAAACIGSDYLPRAPEGTVLYQVLQEHLETFLERVERDGRSLPRFVIQELRGFLRCGIRAHGFVRVRCPKCRHEFGVAFSCKGRGWCPSCGGRFMAQTAAHLVEHVLPEGVGYRQW